MTSPTLLEERAPDAAPSGNLLTRARTTLRRPLILVAAGAVVALTAGGGVAAAAHKTVEVDVNGETRNVSIFAGSVGGALSAAGIQVNPNDEVTPDLDAAVSEGDEIVVRQARSVEISVDGQTEVLWTTAGSATEALGDLAASGRSAQVVASRSTNGERTALDLPLVEAGTVTVLADGASHAVEVAGPTQVADVLAKAGVALGELDRVLVSVDGSGAPTVTVSRVVRGEQVDTQPIAFTTREQPDANVYEGERRVVQAGVNGEVQRQIRILTVDGALIYSALAKETVTTQPVEQIVAVGTKKRPVAATPTATATASRATASRATGSAPAGVWGALAQCESGGNPGIVSANGLYHGLYQFSVGTWRSVGGSGLPSQASAAEQTQRAQALQARSGWGPWPHCSAKLGLR